jgi:hypothetical protein
MTEYKMPENGLRTFGDLLEYMKNLEKQPEVVKTPAKVHKGNRPTQPIIG